MTYKKNTDRKLQVKTASVLNEVVSDKGKSAPKSKNRDMPKKSNPGRKRKRDPATWKNNVRKKKKNAGEEFVNQRGKLMRKKEMKPGCNEKCMRKCPETLTAEIRKQIFNDFWALGDHCSQMQFVSRCVERVAKKQVLLAKIDSTRRHCTYKYHFVIGRDKKQICKKMFLNTLDITDKWITTIYKKSDMQESHCFVLDDRRGRHENRPNKISEDIKQTVRLHISQIPLVSSHYVRARSEKKYFEATLTFPKLYKLYRDWLQENHYESTLKATERQYRDIFYNEFNIDFFKPKKDNVQRVIYITGLLMKKKSLFWKITQFI